MGLEKKGWASFFYAIGAGTFAFFSFIGAGALLPKNIAWLNEGDPATFYLGWSFFRHTPWSIPLGLNPHYGLELSSSILFSDSNPLLAFLFKPFSALLPEPFQYFGLWLLICFVLQAWFAYQLMSLISKNDLIRLLGASFFICAPTLIWRMQGHYSLSGHFLILAALYLALMPSLQRRIIYWAVLLVMAALIHPYLLVMVGALWCADCLDRLIHAGWSLKCLWFFLSLFLEGTIIFGLVFFACWQAGYFAVISDLISSGYGEYRMNVLSIIDPQGTSYLLPDLAKNGNSFEGFNYLGLGVILLGCSILFYALPTSFAKCTQLIFRGIGKWPALALGLLCLTAFAITHLVGIGSFEYNISLPQSIINIANHFRASGRMFWPAYYFMILTILYFVIRLFSTRVAIILLTLALLIQYIDASKMWLDLRAKYSAPPSTAWPHSMTDSFWNRAGLQYKKVRWIMPGNRSENWQAIASYAATHGMATDAVYLARTNTIALSDAQKKARETLLSGNYEADSLYFLDESILPQAALNFDSQRDLFAKIDGFYIIAPRWKCSTCQAEKGEMNIANFLPAPLALGERLVFKKNRPGLEYLGGGWSLQEDWGTWSDGAKAMIILPVNSALAKTILIEARPLLYAAHHQQVIQASINGVTANKVTLTVNAPTQFAIAIPLAVQEQLRSKTKLMILKLQFPDAVRPMDIGMGEDSRILAIGLISLVVQ